MLHGDKGVIMTTKISSIWMLVVFAPVILPLCMNVTTDNVTQLWHCKYGHLSFKGLDTLITKDMLKGIPNSKSQDKTCSDCLMRKKHK